MFVNIYKKFINYEGFRISFIDEMLLGLVVGRRDGGFMVRLG